MKNRRNARNFTTAAALAKALGRHPSTVSRWLRRDDWPYARRPPWPRKSLPDIVEWASVTLDAYGWTEADLEQAERMFEALTGKSMEENERDIVAALNEPLF